MIKKLRLKILLATILFLSTAFSHVNGQTEEHLLDGTSLEFYYQNGSGISIEFQDGKLNYEWILGPPKGNMGTNIPYSSRKIGDEMYLVNFHESQKPDFVSLIFNFKQNVMYSTAILRYGTDMERISFNGGIIEHVNR